MTKEYNARVVVALRDEFAKAVNENGLQYADLPELDALKIVLASEKATLTNVMRDFEYYVQSSDAHGAAPSPMIDWSRDATTSDRAKSYYASKFVVTQHAGSKVFSMDVAERIRDSLTPLEGQGVVDKVRVDSMDPAQNPPIPQKYFG
jgi:hypothetical protein